MKIFICEFEELFISSFLQGDNRVEIKSYLGLNKEKEFYEEIKSEIQRNKIEKI